MAIQASSAENISIRRANEKDAEVLLDLSTQTFTQAFGKQQAFDNMSAYMASAFTIEQILEELKDDTSVFFMAYVNTTDLPVGYAKLRKGKNPRELRGIKAIEIHRIYVKEEMIGKKIGKALMEQCLELAQRENYHVIWLGVSEKNHRAINFYKKWGFQKFSSHMFRLDVEDQRDYLMKKDLV